MKQSGMWTLLEATCMNEVEEKDNTRVVGLGASDGLKRKRDKVLDQ